MKKTFLFTKKRKNLITLVCAASAFFLGIVLIWISTLKIPTLDSYETRRISESTKIFDRTGEILLYDVNQDTRRTVVPLDEISRNVRNATIAIEDREFYEHNGIKPLSILRAIFANTTSLGYNQGGSTITQQVVKLSLLTSEKKISRKIKEWVLAVKLEKILTKDQILERYFNEIPYGGNIYGVEEASQAFFGKKASDLTIAESAYLAALPQAPTYYSPYGNHTDKLEARKNLVLQEMLRNGFINQDDYNSAKNEQIVFKPKQTGGIKAPHFVFYVLDELNKKYGEDVVQNGGLRVKTTLDYGMQQTGEELIKPFAIDNKEKFNAENAAFVAIDPKTGQILTMIGSRDYFDKEIDGNFNVAIAHRQPGSTFKPFVYSEAFIKGYTPETVLFDVKTQFSTFCAPDNLSNTSPCYAPDNYDLKYRGPITLRESLAQSINITSVKTLYLAGIKDSINLAKNLGIESLGDTGQYGLTLVLGGGEVSPLEMASAYSVFADGGVRHPYTAILEVKNSRGDVLESWEDSPKNVLPREVALKISDILSDNVARAPAFGESSYLFIPNKDVAVKTGTTNDYRDAWIIGYTPNIVLAAWAGNNDNSPMEKKVAGFIVAPMWRAFMDKILEKLPDERFEKIAKETSLDLKPVLRGFWQGGISNKIDTVSGGLATEYTPQETIKEILSGGAHSILYWVDKDNPRGPIPTDPSSDPQFPRWEYSVDQWVKKSGYNIVENPVLPSQTDNIHTSDSVPEVTLLSPSTGKSYAFDENIQVIFNFKSKRGISKAQYFINGSLIGESSTNQTWSFSPKDIPSIRKVNELRVVAYDSAYNKGEVVVDFNVMLPEF